MEKGVKLYYNIQNDTLDNTVIIGRIIKMKCTSCGNTNLWKTYWPLESYGDGGASLSRDVDVYLCLECGHYEFYSQKKYKNIMTRFL